MRAEPKISVWEGCYELQWSGVIAKEAFAHPAKFSRGLIERIYDYCLARGYLRTGDLVGDPFGGIATGGITAAYRRLLWVGVELEPRFVKLAWENIALHRGRWLDAKYGGAVILNGDSRKFHELIGQWCAEHPEVRDLSAAITSPPYADSISSKESGIDWSKGTDGRDFTKEARHHELRKPMGLEYGITKGQIGALKSGAIDGAITSPPYADIAAGAGGLNTRPARRAGQQCGRRAALASQNANQRYGEAEGQISRLKGGDLNGVVTSPPYADSLERPSGIDQSKVKNPGGPNCQTHHDIYGKSNGQIAGLKSGQIDAAVTSPPYADSIHGGGKVTTPRGDKVYCESMVKKYHDAPGQIGKLDARQIDAAVLAQAARDEQKIYGDAAGNIGNDSKETYWEAMKAVYGSCRLCIKPGGVLVIVVKDYVAKKQRVPLCDDTCRLLEHVGFTVVERIHAMLVSRSVHADLFAGETTVTRERKSFFRRLAEKKGSPKIDFEEVIIAVAAVAAPLANRGRE